ncbi:MAG: AraC family transcriptional regulator [Haliscomenobacter sp.]|nr:AraC family transcriptional regulator [Haliscomenobacter sp.]MBK8877976.1 AraC family transcriptional regulator [Haliscomenobacter sp.]
MLFEFNLYSGLLLPPFLHGVIYSGMLFVRGIREGRLSDRLLALLVVLFTLRVANWMFGFAGWYDSHDAYSTFMFYFPFNFWLAFGPLVYFYFRSLTNGDFRFRKTEYFHFLPAALWLLYRALIFVKDVLIDFGLKGQPFPYHFGTKGGMAEKGIPLIDGIFDSLDILSVLVYLFLTLRVYRRYQRYLNNQFSDTEGIDFAWLGRMLYAIGIALGVFAVFRLTDYLGTRPLTYIELWYSYFAWGLIIYYLSIAGFHQLSSKAPLLHFVPEQDASEPAEPPNLAEWAPWREKLLALMDSQKPFLNPDLNLQELAGQLGIPPNSLSKVINGLLGKNFNDFVNEYRVLEAKIRLADPQNSHLSILGIAFECGFNSKATFNRAFRKYAHQAPSEFLQSLKSRP